MGGIPVHDANDVNEDDFTAAAGLLDEAKAAIDTAQTEHAAAIADGKGTAQEVADLAAKVEAAQNKLNEAKDAISALPEGSAKDALATEVPVEQARLDGIP
ncbi:hypothetical protein, partial [Acinetobacter indicus]|uniref:hypothetical protein n=1 Tax=Acinetobacter indicus TaxID=756892 RepID=UPI000A48025D